MSDKPPERWHLILDIPYEIAPPAVTARRLLKHILRTWNIRCVGYSLDQHTLDLQEENKRLRQAVEALETKLENIQRER